MTIRSTIYKNCALLAALFCIALPLASFSSDPSSDWQLGEFERVDDANPILMPCADSIFHCPIQDKDVHWEGEYIFNPGAVVRNEKVYLIYRAEDDFGVGCGKHTSRLGIAESSDGIHFQRSGVPILFPDHDEQSLYEFPGGCEDPRIVETEEGTYVMTYTQWNRQVAVLGIATSDDLLHWKKHGYAFEKDFSRHWSKSGSIVCRCEGNRLIATKIQGKYWMYWGEGLIHVATSEDLISWKPLLDEDNQPIVILEPRPGKYDSALVEAGPPAILTKDGIILLYNGKNSVKNGDPKIVQKAYSAGQVLIDANDPTKVISRSEECFLTPERPYEMRGQYKGGTVFVQGLVPFQGKWFLYYGTADAAIGVAISSKNLSEEKTTLLLIRHGETDWNTQKRYLGQTNIPLNDHGIEQAKQLAIHMIHHHSDITSIYSSDLDRAFATAQKTAETFGLPVLQRNTLQEINWGIAEGFIVEEIDNLYGQLEDLREIYPSRKERWNIPVFPGGETYNELQLRVQNELKTIARTHAGKKIAIFTHGRIMRTLITESLDYPEVFEPLPNCAIAHFLFTPEKQSCPFTFLKIEHPSFEIR
ncbi:MAG: histidine phosphatase family protein [Anaerolineae bacterium]